MQQTGTYAEMAFCVKLISLFGSLNKVVIITTAEHRQIYEEIPTVCSVVVEESLMQLTAIEQRELIESFHADSFVSLSHNETIADLVYNCRIPLRINAATDCYYSHLFNQMVLVDSSKRQALIMDLLGFDQLPERQAIKFASKRKKDSVFTIFLAPSYDHYIIYKQLELLLYADNKIIWFGDCEKTALETTVLINETSNSRELLDSLSLANIVVCSEHDFSDFAGLVDVDIIHIDRVKACPANYLDIIYNIFTQIVNYKNMACV
ncbi:MAG: hypothetical protein CMF46_02770 [Legionellales bacterium]|nr:hypothetical protein [Legionellales bacterium]